MGLAGGGDPDSRRVMPDVRRAAARPGALLATVAGLGACSSLSARPCARRGRAGKLSQRDRDHRGASTSHGDASELRTRDRASRSRARPTASRSAARTVRLKNVFAMVALSRFRLQRKSRRPARSARSIRSIPAPVKPGGYGSGSGGGRARGMPSMAPPDVRTVAASLRARVRLHRRRRREDGHHARLASTTGAPAGDDARGGAWRATRAGAVQRRDPIQVSHHLNGAPEAWICPIRPTRPGRRRLRRQELALRRRRCARAGPAPIAPAGAAVGLRLARRGALLRVRRSLPRRRAAATTSPSATQAQAPANWRRRLGGREDRRSTTATSPRSASTRCGSPCRIDNTESSGLGDDGAALQRAITATGRAICTKTESRFGIVAELKALVDAAHSAGIKVLIDYAMNHVHKDSPIYQAHMNDGWFNPLSRRRPGVRVRHRRLPVGVAYAKTCWFPDYLPDFNFNNADARKFSVDNALDVDQDLRLRRLPPRRGQAHRDLVAHRSARAR